ncbi:MAG: MBL fold metallo-hydrolase [Gemmatimonadaceae bacterium]
MAPERSGDARPAPEEEPQAKPVAMRVTYIGHATLLLEMGGVRILTDPNFDPRLARFLRRVSAPGIALGDLPALDALLLTHAHADHLSFASLNALPRDVPLFAPPAVARWLRRLGYARAEPIAPGETIQVAGLQLTAASAKHLGSRYAVDRWRSAANMYLLDGGSAACFFAGDTALTADSHRMVAEHIVEAKRVLDVALLPIGHAPWWKPGYRRGHMTFDDALTLFERMRARYFIPYHWGTFHHVTSGPFDAIRRLRVRLEQHHRSADVKILEPGMAFELEAG